MNILVCVKQVPDTTEIKIDPVTNTLIRAGVPSIVNPFDAYALEVAARIKDKKPDTVITVVAMGPEQAKVALRSCLAVGADTAYLVSDRAFGGSDTLATSYILSATIRYLEKKGTFDVIFCGKQAIDGDTAQVGPEMAEHLGRPQLTYAVDAEPDGDKLRVRRETEEGYDLYEVTLPAVISVTKPLFEPRMPSIKSNMTARKAEITTIAAADLDIDLTRAGLKGSPTKVKKTFTPQVTKQGVRIQEAQAQDSAKKLALLLFEAKLV
jgi:electron transfer flavoprotein beta subunit